ncbi:non-ribosomal peptide synthetase [Streptomyces vinaceus]|uniref:non-ribosomal peptide synthetase n=1 Tax=Streptomyces vinaceus TaxID=1960 RepID=UPI0037F6AD0E
MSLAPTAYPRHPHGETAGPRITHLPAAVLEQARLSPDRSAVISAEATLTYGQLLDQAGALAQRLRAAGAGRETAVGLCLPRTTDLVTATLGIWLAGAACVPIDPTTPRRRRDQILRDADVTVAVTSSSLSAELPGVTCVPPQTVQPVPNRPAATRAPADRWPSSLAYIVYTSGTTGTPKGVMVEHHSLAAMAAAHEEVLHSTALLPVRRVALNGGLGSDTFFSDLANLASGRTLVIVDEPTRRDPERLVQLLADQHIELLDSTPTQIRALLLAKGTPALAALTTLILGGEPIDPALWTQLRALPHVQVYNFYGPTECTIDATMARLAEHSRPVIGTELPGSRVWVLDRYLQPVPDGEAGELCISGTGVARGYTRTPLHGTGPFLELRTEDGAPPVRAYRTGDRGRRTPSGALEFLGRTDEQVSVNGYRVELGDVEAALRACDGVQDVAVAALERDSGLSLAAWTVLVQDTTVDAVRQDLASRLPAHMLPQLNQVTCIPMGPSGKAETIALKADASPQPATDDPALPDKVRALWCQALGIPRVNVGDDFFALGGDSLAATQMIVTTRTELGLAIPIRTIFDHPRFTDFCRQLASQAGPR